MSFFVCPKLKEDKTNDKRSTNSSRGKRNNYTGSSRKRLELAIKSTPER